MTANQKERPLLFSGEMVRALLAGTKTQTRRVVTVPWWKSKRALPYSPYWDGLDGKLLGSDEYGDWYPAEQMLGTYRLGERRWVREAWAQASDDSQYWSFRRGKPAPELPIVYRATWSRSPIDSAEDEFWRPSIFMPRWASRITLELNSVRIERLQAITEDDALAEGMTAVEGVAGWNIFREDGSHCWTGQPDEPVRGVDRVRDYVRAEPLFGCSARDGYRQLWDSLNGKKPGCAWADSPWVWVLGVSVLPQEQMGRSVSA